MRSEGLVKTSGQTQVKLPRTPAVFYRPIKGIRFLNGVNVDSAGNIRAPWGALGRIFDFTGGMKFPAVVGIKWHPPQKLPPVKSPLSWHCPLCRGFHPGVGHLLRVEILPPKREIKEPEKLPVLMFIWNLDRATVHSRWQWRESSTEYSGRYVRVATCYKSSTTELHSSHVDILLVWYKLTIKREWKRRYGRKLEEWEEESAVEV